MKFFESHYEEYVREVDKYSLHPDIKKMVAGFPKNIEQFQNIILYGPRGVGKYSQALKMISIYSPSHMKYEKRIAVAYNKETFFVKISDIHFEVDMSLLGCNSKHIWNEIYNQIIDIISSRPNNTAIIMCKNFHKIHSELLETFYSYMQEIEFVSLKFVIITENVSFLPDNITQQCQIIPLKRPSLNSYNKVLFGKPITPNIPGSGKSKIRTDNSNSNNNTNYILPSSTILKHLYKKQSSSYQESTGISTCVHNNGINESVDICKLQQNVSADIFQTIQKTPMRLTSEFKLHNITNIKSLKANITELLVPHENICLKLIQLIKAPTSHLQYDVLRDILYDLLIYDIDIQECIWFILDKLIQDGNLRQEHMDNVMIKMNTFLKYFNNNYRPIYHLENFILILICHIHGFKHTNATTSTK